MSVSFYLPELDLENQKSNRIEVNCYRTESHNPIRIIADLHHLYAAMLWPRTASFLSFAFYPRTTVFCVCVCDVEKRRERQYWVARDGTNTTNGWCKETPPISRRAPRPAANRNGVHLPSRLRFWHRSCSGIYAIKFTLSQFPNCWKWRR